MMRLSFLLLLVVAAACYAQKCARRPIPQKETDSKWPGYAVSSPMNDRSYHARVIVCSPETPNIYYKGDDGQIRRTDKMTCLNGKWIVGYGNRKLVGTAEVSCVADTRTNKPIKPNKQGTCAKLDVISQQEADTFWPGSAPNTIASPNITDNGVICGGNTPHAYYKNKDGNIRRLYGMVCADGKWEVDHALSYNTTEVACVGRVIKCPALGQISQDEANAEWTGSAPNAMTYPTPQDQRLFCSGDTKNFHWVSSEDGSVHLTDQMVCNKDGKWRVNGGKHEIVGFAKVACLGETIKAAKKKCIRPENISHDELKVMRPGKRFYNAHFGKKVASCNRIHSYLVYKTENGQITETYGATRMTCNKNKEWVAVGLKGDEEVIKAPKISCVRLR